MVQERARETGAAFAMCNLVGGQDELVFDGHSVVVSPAGETLARAAQFAEELVVCDLELPRIRRRRRRARTSHESSGAGGGYRPGARRLRGPGAQRRGRAARSPIPWSPSAEVYEALKLGLRDYVRKNGFERVLVAVSGGIDSALVTLIAADALGPERVSCVVMPSPHSSEETQADARTIVEHVGAESARDPDRARDARLRGAAARRRRTLAADRARSPRRCRRPTTGGGEHPGADSRQPDDGALEQVRLAGAHDRQQERDVGRLRDPLRRHGGWLRGDQGRPQDARLSAGPVPKRACRNRAGAGVVLERPPSAELRPGQLDEDSLPPYEILDRILAAYVEEDRGRDEIVAEGSRPTSSTR